MIDDPAGQLTDQLADEHERLGRAVTAIIAEYAGTLDTRKVTSPATPKELEQIFDEPFPEHGLTTEEILARFTRDVLAHAMQVPSPRYYGQFNPTPLPIGVWALVSLFGTDVRLAFTRITEMGGLEHFDPTIPPPAPSSYDGRRP